MSGFDSDLLTGFAQLLATNIDALTWRDDGSAYDPAETGIFLMKMPATPDRCVVLTAYSLGDDPALSDSTVGLQVRTRGIPDDTLDAIDLDAAIFDFLAGQFSFGLPTGIAVSTLLRRSSVPLGVDDNRRSEHSSNYELDVHRPSLHRI